ncbi:MAG: TldD/PmbA family protein [Acidobacteriota bacterium]
MLEPAEIFCESTRTVSLTREEGRLLPPRTGVDAGTSVRLWTDGGDRFACRSGIDEPAIRECLSLLGGKPEWNLARLAIPGNSGRLADDGELRSGSAGFRRRIVNWLREAEISVCAVLPEAVSCRSVFREFARRVWILLPDGSVQVRSFHWAHAGIRVAARVNGTTHNGLFRAGGIDPESLLKDHPPSRCAAVAVEDLDESRQSTRELSGEMPVVLSAAAAGTFFHEVCGHLLEGDAPVGAGTGLLPGGVGSRIRDPLTVFDDPTVPGFGGSAAVDDEGTACRKTPLIADGRVVGRLLDRRGARLRASDPTGSGRRASFRDRPLPRLGNLFVTGGREGAGEAAGSCRWGILIEELESGRVDPYTGEFRLVGRRGHLLRRGKADRPVRGVQVFGSAVESLDRIEVLEQDGSAVGTTGSCLKEGQSLLTGLCSPPVRIGGLAVRSRTEGTDADG